MTTPDPAPLLAALADMPDEALRRVSVAAMRLALDHADDSPVLDRRGWHALAALAADVAAVRRAVLDELERAFDDREIGAILPESGSDDGGSDARPVPEL